MQLNNKVFVEDSGKISFYTIVDNSQYNTLTLRSDFDNRIIINVDRHNVRDIHSKNLYNAKFNFGDRVLYHNQLCIVLDCQNSLYTMTTNDNCDIISRGENELIPYQTRDGNLCGDFI
jgi:hypothetical protein